jgi:hypothetical protein
MTTLVEDVKRNNAPAIAGKLPIDITWYVQGRGVMFDLKTIPDFIASYMDGRIHSQLTSMQAADNWFYGFMLIGDPTSYDGGIMVGDSSCTWDGFDDAFLDIQIFGGRRAHSEDNRRVSRPPEGATCGPCGTEDYICAGNRPLTQTARRV